jgi:putative transposase
VKYQFIRDHTQEFPVRLMCQVLAVAPSGYYDWVDRPKSSTQQRREQLEQRIRVIHAAVKRRYGSPRIHAELRDQDETCCVNTVAKIMRAAGIQAVSHRKFRVQTTDSRHDFPVAENHLNQTFVATKPDEVWLSDITYIHTSEGILYLATVLDLYSRMVVGWSMNTSMESRLVVDALAMAIQRRLPGEDLLLHSDRGSQYASEHYQRVLDQHNITCSMSRVGNCYDNAPMESFWASLKKEVVFQEAFPTIEAAKASLFEYIEVFYNRQRRHSALDYRSPAEFECINHS